MIYFNLCATTGLFCLGTLQDFIPKRAKKEKAAIIFANRAITILENGMPKNM